MNIQNILRSYGSKLDIKLDSSEFYDYTIEKVDTDYNIDVLDLSTPITYTTLKIDQSLNGASCSRNTIYLVEYDNSTNDLDYKYSGLTACIDYDNFIGHFETNYEHTILNNQIFSYTY